jgi:hypothetical protein
MLHVQLEGTEPLVILYDNGMQMYISSRGHCTQRKYAKLFSSTEAEAILLHAEKNGYKLSTQPAEKGAGEY